MRRFTDFLTGTLAGMLIGVLMVGAIAPDAWQPISAPRPSQHADPGPGTPGMTTEPPLPSPDVAGSAGPPDPQPAPAHGPTPSATGTRPAQTARPRTATPPRATRSVRGTATWFRSPSGVSAAGPALRAAVGPGWRGTRVTVSGPAGTARTVLGDFMRADKLIDLHAPLFTAVCGPLSKGVCRVSVRW